VEPPEPSLRLIGVKMSLRIVVLLAGVGLAAAACGPVDQHDSRAGRPASATPGSGASTSPSATPSASPTPPATPTPSPPRQTPPSRPPAGPTDQFKPGWVVGTVTADSTGPCYGLVTDDGKQYALYTTKGFTAHKGERLRVRLGRLALKIYCGPGQHASIEERRPVR
jgi:hypothetical protein